MLLRAFSLGDFDAQAFVRLLQRDRPLLHTAVQLGVRITQRMLILPERSLGGDPLGDIDGVTENVRIPPGSSYSTLRYIHTRARPSRAITRINPASCPCSRMRWR